MCALGLCSNNSSVEANYKEHKATKCGSCETSLCFSESCFRHMIVCNQATYHSLCHDPVLAVVLPLTQVDACYVAV